MKKTTLTILSSVLLLGGCANSGTQTLNSSDPRECVKNFTYSGNFLAGRTYKSHAYIEGVSREAAMERAAQYTVNGGWAITNTDKDLGIISASQTVSYGQGKTVPLNISIESINNGVNVSMSYSTSGGVSSPLDAIKNHFCSTMKAISGK